MSAVKNLLKSIEQGKKGKNIGISTGLPDIDKVIYGIQKKYLYVVGADTSGGKTSFALDIFVYNAIKNSGGKKINILYYSFEMASEVLLAKLLSRYIWDTYNVIITFEDILSLTSPISDSKYVIIEKCVPWLTSVNKILTTYDKPISPNHIYGTCKGWLEKFGKFVPVGDHRENYIENDPEEYKIVLIDHVGLIGGQGSKKERIDTTVNYLIHFRNKCNITGVLIQQLNRNAKSMDRKTNGYELIQLDDFKETSDTTDGAEVVIGLYYPHREKIAKVDGYPIKDVLRYKFRLVQIIKNRYGRSDINKGTIFHGEISMFKELPKSEDIAISDYEKYMNLEYKEEIQEDDVNTEEDNNLQMINDNDVFKL